MYKLETLVYLSILYNESHRHYHNINHIHACLGEYQVYCREAQVYSDEDVIEAIWWHDAIYNPYSVTNEWDSAILYKNSTDNYKEVVFNAITDTARHTEDLKIITPMEKIVLDLDLSSLGYRWELFNQNSENIKKEYYFVDDVTFYVNRIKFLKTLLARKSIYYTPYFFNKFETKARENIEKAIHDATRKLNI